MIALRDEAELHAYVPPAFAAFAIEPAGTPLRQPMIVLAAESNVADVGVIEAHELTHVVSHGVIHVQPHWFAEGLAKFYETVKLDSAAGTADIGLPPTVLGGRRARVHHLTSVASILACRQMACLDAGFYATAWALFTYLANVRPADLARLEDALEASHGDGERAWAEVFGAGSEVTIDGELRRWLAHGTHSVIHFKIALASRDVAVRPLADADVYAARALLRAPFGAGGPAAIAREVDAALALDPTNVVARLVDAGLDRPHDLAAARATATAHADDWRAWFTVHGLAPLDLVARDQACALASRNPALSLPPGECPGR